MALPGDILYRTIPRFLPPASKGRLAQTSRQASVVPSLHECCKRPSARELIDYLIEISRYIGEEEFSPENSSSSEDIIAYRQIGIEFILEPFIDKMGTGWYVRFTDGNHVKKLRSRRDMEKHLLAPKLEFTQANIKVFVRILRKRGSCLRLLPRYINSCVIKWFKREISETVLEEYFLTSSLYELFDILDLYRDPDGERSYLDEIRAAISDLKKEFPEGYIPVISIERGTRGDVMFSSQEARELLLERIKPILDEISAEDYDFTSID